MYYESHVAFILSSVGLRNFTCVVVFTLYDGDAGRYSDSNLLFYKECIKLLMMVGALMILMALTKNESEETEAIRIKAMRNAVFITIAVIFGTMLYRVSKGDLVTVDTSSFLSFLIIHVICLEFGLKKAAVDRFFKR